MQWKKHFFTGALCFLCQISLKTTHPTHADKVKAGSHQSRRVWIRERAMAVQPSVEGQLQSYLIFSIIYNHVVSVILWPLYPWANWPKYPGWAPESAYMQWWRENFHPHQKWTPNVWPSNTYDDWVTLHLLFVGLSTKSDSCHKY
jgi:hypothetical protein